MSQDDTTEVAPSLPLPGHDTGEKTVVMPEEQLLKLRNESRYPPPFHPKTDQPTRFPRPRMPQG